MRAVQVLTRLVAQTLPGNVRGRFREEWLADLARAPEIGVSRWGVLLGAVAMSVRLERDNPAVTGIPMAIQAVRRARWAAVLLGSALLLVFAAFVGWATTDLGSDSLGTWLGAVGGIVAFFVVFGVVNAVKAVQIGIAVYGTKPVMRIALTGLGGAVMLLVVALVPITGMLAAFGAVATTLFLAAGGPRGQRPQRPLGTRARVGLSVAFSALTVVTVAVGAVHVLVWNPLAKIPGLGLSEIYAALAVAQEPSGVGLVAAWAGIFVIAAVAFPVCCALPRFAGSRSTRRIVVVGALLVAAAAMTQWLAGFTTGMSLADTFATSGGDAAVSGPILAVVALLAVMTALFAGFAPGRWQAPEAGLIGHGMPAT